MAPGGKMDAAAFLARTVPLDRWIYTVVKFPDARWSAKGFQQPADAVKFGAWGVSKGCDVYYACAGFATQGTAQTDGKIRAQRTQENVATLKSLWLDVDYGKPSGYKTAPEAIAAVGKMVAGAGLPPPTLIVSTGNGFHVYWTMDRPVPKAEWFPLAHALANAARAQGLHADLQCTIDCARILRLPGTLNRKDPANAKAVNIVGLSPSDVPVELMHEKLLPHRGTSIVLPSPGGVPIGARTSDLSAGLEQARNPSYVENIVTNCGVFARIAETRGAEGNYEHWRDMLNVLPYTEDGDAWVHRLSEGHRTYTADVTNKHYEYAKSNKAKRGPTECATLMAHPEFAAICQRCPHLGAVKTPWSVGHAKLADLPPGFMRDGKSIYRNVIDDEGQPKRITVVRGDILDFKVASLAADEFEEQNHRLTFTYAAPTGRRYPVVMNYLDLPDNKAGTQKLFGAKGVNLDPVGVTHFRELIMSWTQTLRDQRKEQQGAVRTFGWHELDKKTGFAFADQITFEDGSSKPLGAIDREMRRVYHPVGEFEKWQTAAQFFLDHSQPALRALVASTFAAPLVPLTGMSGLLFSVVSTKSGAGKSTAIQVAQSVWGDPVRGVNSLSDTPLSIQRKMALLRSLPVFWDEIRGQKNVEAFIATVFQLSQGKDRSRLNQAAEMREIGEWATMLVCASNNSILDTMAAEQGGTDAGFLRTFEIEAVVGATDVSHVEMTSAMMALQSHYATAGQRYAQFLARNREMVARTINTEKARLDRLTASSQDERFWLSTVSTLVVGAALATASGVIKFNVPALREFLLDALVKLRRQRGEETFASSTEESSMVDVLNRFLYEYSAERLLTDHCTTAGVFKGVGRMVAPKSERVAYHLATETKILRVPRSLLRGWLHKHKIPRKKWLAEAQRVLGTTLTFSKFAAGTPYGSLGQIWVIDFNLQNPLLSQLVNSATEQLTSAGSESPGRSHGSQTAT